MITKYQQGGNMEQQIVNLVYAAMSGDQQATQQINQIMQAAKSGDKRAVQLASYIQQITQKLQGSRKADQVLNLIITKKQFVPKMKYLYL